MEKLSLSYRLVFSILFSLLLFSSLLTTVHARQGAGDPRDFKPQEPSSGNTRDSGQPSGGNSNTGSNNSGGSGSGSNNARDTNQSPDRTSNTNDRDDDDDDGPYSSQDDDDRSNNTANNGSSNNEDETSFIDQVVKAAAEQIQAIQTEVDRITSNVLDAAQNILDTVLGNEQNEFTDFSNLGGDDTDYSPISPGVSYDKQEYERPNTDNTETKDTEPDTAANTTALDQSSATSQSTPDVKAAKDEINITITITDQRTGVTQSFENPEKIDLSSDELRNVDITMKWDAGPNATAGLVDGVPITEVTKTQGEAPVSVSTNGDIVGVAINRDNSKDGVEAVAEYIEITIDSKPLPQSAADLEAQIVRTNKDNPIDTEGSFVPNENLQELTIDELLPPSQTGDGPAAVSDVRVPGAGDDALARAERIRELLDDVYTAAPNTDAPQAFVEDEQFFDDAITELTVGVMGSDIITSRETLAEARAAVEEAGDESEVHVVYEAAFTEYQTARDTYDEVIDIVADAGTGGIATEDLAELESYIDQTTDTANILAQGVDRGYLEVAGEQYELDPSAGSGANTIDREANQAVWDSFFTDGSFSYGPGSDEEALIDAIRDGTVTVSLDWVDLGDGTYASVVTVNDVIVPFSSAGALAVRDVLNEQGLEVSLPTRAEADTIFNSGDSDVTLDIVPENPNAGSPIASELTDCSSGACDEFSQKFYSQDNPQSNPNGDLNLAGGRNVGGIRIQTASRAHNPGGVPTTYADYSHSVVFVTDNPNQGPSQISSVIDQVATEVLESQPGGSYPTYARTEVPAVETSLVPTARDIDPTTQSETGAETIESPQPTENPRRTTIEILRVIDSAIPGINVLPEPTVLSIDPEVPSFSIRDVMNLGTVPTDEIAEPAVDMSGLVSPAVPVAEAIGDWVSRVSNWGTGGSAPTETSVANADIPAEIDRVGGVNVNENGFLEVAVTINIGNDQTLPGGRQTHTETVVDGETITVGNTEYVVDVNYDTEAGGSVTLDRQPQNAFERVVSNVSSIIGDNTSATLPEWSINDPDPETGELPRDVSNEIFATRAGLITELIETGVAEPSELDLSLSDRYVIERSRRDLSATTEAQTTAELREQLASEQITVDELENQTLETLDITPVDRSTLDDEQAALLDELVDTIQDELTYLDNAQTTARETGSREALAEVAEQYEELASASSLVDLIARGGTGETLIYQEIESVPYSGDPRRGQPERMAPEREVVFPLSDGTTITLSIPEVMQLAVARYNTNNPNLPAISGVDAFSETRPQVASSQSMRHRSQAAGGLSAAVDFNILDEDGSAISWNTSDGFEVWQSLQTEIQQLGGNLNYGFEDREIGDVYMNTFSADVSWIHPPDDSQIDGSSRNYSEFGNGLLDGMEVSIVNGDYVIEEFAEPEHNPFNDTLADLPRNADGTIDVYALGEGIADRESRTIAQADIALSNAPAVSSTPEERPWDEVIRVIDSAIPGVSISPQPTARPTDTDEFDYPPINTTFHGSEVDFPLVENPNQQSSGETNPEAPSFSIRDVMNLGTVPTDQTIEPIVDLGGLFSPAIPVAQTILNTAVDVINPNTTPPSRSTTTSN